MKLDIGCGKHITEGYEGVDKTQTGNVKYVVNLEHERIPVADNSVDEVVCRHFLEHVQNIFHCMDEIHRVMKPDAVMHVIVPHYKSRHAFQDPTHVRFFTEKTFKYWDGEYIQQYADYNIKAVFETKQLYVHGEDWEHLWIYADLAAKK